MNKMSIDREFFMSRKKRTVVLRIAPGSQPIDRYDFIGPIERVVDLRNMEAFGSTAERGTFQITLANEYSAKLFIDKGDFI